jgi:hypothetical protein
MRVHISTQIIWKASINQKVTWMLKVVIQTREGGLGLWLSGRIHALLMCEALGLIPQHHKNKQTKLEKALEPLVDFLCILFIL